MGKVVDLFSKKRISPDDKMILQLSDDIDALFKKWLMNPKLKIRDLAGVVAHRLGSLLLLVDKKQELWDVCADIAKKQAKVK